MRVEVAVVAECPHEASARVLLREALNDVGLGAESVAVRVVESQEMADELHFLGSPAFLVDGRDVFDDLDRPAVLACRIYSGGRSLPSLGDLRRALKEVAAERRLGPGRTV